MNLLTPLTLGPCEATSRVMFGPHVTNLGDDDRRFTSRHTAYYARRAGRRLRHHRDRGRQRARQRLALRTGTVGQPLWSGLARRSPTPATSTDALVIASLDHAGGQGSSAYNQLPLLAPSRVPEVNSRETPKWMEPDDIDAVIAGFAEAAGIATNAGCDGVEINAGQHSLVRQFLSGLTNHRDDPWGQDRLLFARQVIAAVRPHTPLLGLRLCCDELAPWAGITPDMAPADRRQPRCRRSSTTSWSCAVRSTPPRRPGPTSTSRPGSTSTSAERSRPRCSPTPVFLQGSIVDCGQAEWALDEGVCDGVEMTRAQIADPDLVAKLRCGSRRPRSAHASAATRRARCATSATRSSAASASRRQDERPRTPIGTRRRPSRATSSSSAVVSPGWRQRASRRLAGTTSPCSTRPIMSAGWRQSPVPVLRWSPWLESECRRLGVEITTGARSHTREATWPSNARDPSLVAATTRSTIASMVLDIADVRRGVALPAGTDRAVRPDRRADRCGAGRGAG